MSVKSLSCLVIRNQDMGGLQGTGSKMQDLDYWVHCLKWQGIAAKREERAGL